MPALLSAAGAAARARPRPGRCLPGVQSGRGDVWGELGEVLLKYEDLPEALEYRQSLAQRNAGIVGQDRRSRRPLMSQQGEQIRRMMIKRTQALAGADDRCPRQQEHGLADHHQTVAS